MSRFFAKVTTLKTGPNILSIEIWCRFKGFLIELYSFLSYVNCKNWHFYVVLLYGVYLYFCSKSFSDCGNVLGSFRISCCKKPFKEKWTRAHLEEFVQDWVLKRILFNLIQVCCDLQAPLDNMSFVFSFEWKPLFCKAVPNHLGDKTIRRYGKNTEWGPNLVPRVTWWNCKVKCIMAFFCCVR